MIKDNEVKFVDLRFTDTRGKEQHVSVPATYVDEDKFEDGHAFDGSSIAGWKGIQASDMLLMPDPDTAYIDPFIDEPTLVLTCDVVEPSDGKGYDRDPRSIAKRAEAYLKSTGIGDTAYFGPEPEFFIFDSVNWHVDMSGCFGQDQVRRSRLVLQRKIRRRQHRPPSRPSRAATSRFRRSIRCRTSAPPCAWRWKRSACRSKCITTKWRPPASAKSAPSSAPW